MPYALAIPTEALLACLVVSAVLSVGAAVVLVCRCLLVCVVPAVSSFSFCSCHYGS